MLKWIYSFVGFVFGILFAKFAVIRIIEWFLSNSSKELRGSITGLVGDDELNQQLTSESIVIRDVLFPAWNEYDRYPLFFSLAHKEKVLEKADDYRDEYNMKFSEMISASASNTVYFDPYQYTNKNNGIEKIIGGGSIAESPALYAFFSAEQFIGVDPSKISMTVVGALHKDTEKISGNVNPI